MKRLVLILLSLNLIISLSGCGVSQADYDSLSKENSDLQAQIEELTSENEELSDELLNYQTDEVMDNTHSDVITAWATTSFGDNTLCFSSDDGSYVQCISGKTYSIDEAGLSDLYDDLLLSASTLSYVINGELVDFDTLSVKFFDPNNTFIAEFNFSNTTTNALQSFSCNIMYLDTILPFFSATTSDE